MESTKVETGINLIQEAISELSSQTTSNLENRAPKTTLDAEIRWGLFTYKTEGEQLELYSYNRFLEELFKDFMAARHPESSLEDSKIINLNQKWKEPGSVSGNATVHVGEPVIWISYIPDKVLEDIINLISSRISGKERKYLLEFVEMLNSLPTNPGAFEGSIAHEMTHLWMIQKTKFGKTYSEIINSDIETIKRHVQIVRSGDIEALDEIFGLYTAYVYTGNVRQAADMYGAYGKPEHIEWGIKILKEKAEKENLNLDDIRQIMASVFERLAQKGQLKKGGGQRDAMTFFLIECLPKEDKARLSDFREISEGELSKAFKDLRDALSDMEEYEKRNGNQQTLQDIDQAISKIDWENPSHIHDKILHSVLENAVGNYSLNEVESKIEQNLQIEAKKLNNLKNLCKELISEEDSDNISSEVYEAAQEITKTETDIKRIINYK